MIRNEVLKELVGFYCINRKCEQCILYNKDEQQCEMKKVIGTDTLKDKCISMVGFNTTTNIITITIEELAELIQSLSKLSRYREHDDTLRTTKTIIFNNLSEELADVYLMLEQIKYIYFIKDKDIEEIINKKIERTLNKIQPK